MNPFWAHKCRLLAEERWIISQRFDPAHFQFVLRGGPSENLPLKQRRLLKDQQPSNGLPGVARQEIWVVITATQRTFVFTGSARFSARTNRSKKGSNVTKSVVP